MPRRATSFLNWLWGSDEARDLRSLVRSTPGVWIVFAVTFVVSVADFALPSVMGADLLTHHLGDSSARIARGEVWRLLTPELVNPPFYAPTRYISGAEHLAVNVVGLVLAGIHIERALGTRRFLALYIVAGLGSQVAPFIALPLDWSPSGGSSGSVNGLYGALLAIAFLERGGSRGKRWYWLVSWAVLVIVAMGAFLNSAITNIIHLGGATAGVVLVIAWMLRPVRAARAGIAVILVIVLVSGALVVPKSAAARQVGPAVIGRVAVQREPVLLTHAFGSIWVNGNGNGTLERIDLSTRRVTRFDEPRFGGGMAAVGESMWVAGDRSVVEIDPSSNRVVSSVRVPGEGPWGLAASRGAIWAALPDKGSVARIDLRTRRVGLTRVGKTPYGVLANANGVWATSFESRRVSRLDPDSGRVVEEIRLAYLPYWMEFADGALWVGARTYVYRLEPTTLAVIAKVDVGEGVWTMATDEGGRLWVTERYGFEVSQIDTKKDRVVRRVRVGLGQPNGIAVAGRVWVADMFRRAVLEIEP